MRITLLSLAVILLGIALGVGLSVLRIGTAPWHPDLGQGQRPAGCDRRPAGRLPKVVVDQTVYDFGTLDMAAKGSHDFLFRNAGDAPLKLVSGGTSCRCTLSELGQEEIPPGGSTKVTLTWKPIDKTGPYQQTAKILTNDPARPRVTLTISGRITVAVQLSPPELVFSGAIERRDLDAQRPGWCATSTSRSGFWATSGRRPPPPGTSRPWSGRLRPRS